MPLSLSAAICYCHGWSGDVARGWLSLRLRLYSDVSLREDAAQGLVVFISSLANVKPLPALRLRLTGEQNWPDKTGWTDLIKLATQTINGEQLDKVVLARATDLQFSQSVNAAAVMASSRRLNLNCYHFFMAFSAKCAFTSVLPLNVCIGGVTRRCAPRRWREPLPTTLRIIGPGSWGNG